MKLIDEKEVEQQAHTHVLDEYPMFEFTSILELVFEDGVNFAEQKLLQMMVEFAEWCERNYSSRIFPDGTVLWNLGGVNFTTQQLLEQFINRDK